MLPVMDNSGKADDDRRGVKRKMALSSCDVCETKEAKYRCPSCRKHTCSLACVKQHKMVSGCCGVRDKTAFIPLAEFNEINLLNDYRILEDTARLTQQSNRDRVLLRSRRHPKEGMWMIRKARAVKVTLRFLPKVFSKHRENRTIFRRAEARFYWHLKIHFPQSDAVYSERCPDNRQLDQILNDYIHPSESDPVKRQKLKVYVRSPQEDIRVFLKSEQTQPNSLRYLELDLKTTLQENLMQKTIVEYPEVFVVLQQHSQQYLTRRPERSNVVQGVASASVTRTSCSLAEPRSEALVHVPKKPKVSEDDELEDGEIRSEEEDGNTEDDDGDAENKRPAMHPDGNDDRDEEEVEMKDCTHNSVQDAREDDWNQNKVVSVNITSKTEEIMMVSQGPEEADSTETVTGDARRLCADDKLEKNIHSNAGLPEDHGVQDKNCDNGAMHDEDGKSDTQHDSCIAVHNANVQIQVKLNMHEENADIYSSGSENQANM
ncbi:box C/D snoRNA protein 1-like isoform X2 [Sinocyclocheilus rhinocerous]|uniref:box C/D snoRNA protein 1-like isoform X2 n=1 Tax=Sinocyclocheilus rhinocerous TaxID=307959 RepID=UPI0007B99060|nr:PREDICTED: box C/D snoRNA protein 1-like isoform X2 [Sinocyclocheilus rhinocerous]